MLWDVKGTKKPRRVWIYVSDADSDRIDELLKRYSYLSEAALMSTLLHAALRACEAANYNALPQQFAITLATPTEGARVTLNEKGKK
jgi:hypothetical protein